MSLNFSNSAFRPSQSKVWFGGLTTGSQPDSLYCSADLDDQNNIYVASRNYFAKINNTGPSLVWQKSLYDTTAIISSIIVDTSYNVYIAYTGDNYVNIEKFNSTGIFQWGKQLAVTGRAYSTLSVGASSNIFLSVPNNVFFKLDSSGNIVWQYDTNPIITLSYNTFSFYGTLTNNSNQITGTPNSLAGPFPYYWVIGAVMTLTSSGGPTLPYDTRLTAVSVGATNTTITLSQTYTGPTYTANSSTGLGSITSTGYRLIDGVMKSDTYGNILVTDRRTVIKLSDAGSTASVSWCKYYEGEPFNYAGPRWDPTYTDAICDASGNVYWTHSQMYDDGYGGYNKRKSFKYDSSGVYLWGFTNTFDTTYQDFGQPTLAIDNDNSLLYTATNRFGPYGTVHVNKQRTSNGQRIYGESYNTNVGIFKYSFGANSSDAYYGFDGYKNNFKIKGDNLLIMQPNSNSSISFPTNYIYKWSLSGYDANIYYSNRLLPYSTTVAQLSRKGVIDNNSTRRITNIKADFYGTGYYPNEFNDPSNDIVSGPYLLKSVVANHTTQTGGGVTGIVDIAPSTLPSVVTPSLTATSLSFTTISSNASPSSETLLSRSLYSI